MNRRQSPLNHKDRVQPWPCVAMFTLLLSLISGCSDREASTGQGFIAPELPAEAPVTLNIAVIGGTRGIGLETVKFALARGHRVTAVARNPRALQLQHPQLETYAGDVMDLNSLYDAVAEQDAVVFAVGIKPTWKSVSVFSQGTANVIEAMHTYSTKRLVAVTGIGAGDSRGHGGFWYDKVMMPLVLKTLYDDKNRQEALIKKAGADQGLDWTIVRPGFLNDEPATGAYWIFNDMQGIRAAPISRADVAHFIVFALESGFFLQETVFLREPETPKAVESSDKAPQANHLRSNNDFNDYG